MFDYTKEVVLNSVDNTLGSGNVVAYAEDGASAATGVNGDFLLVKKDGNYKFEHLACAYLAKGKEGNCGKITFHVAGFLNDESTPAYVANQDVIVAFKLFSDAKLQEFASPNWAEFTMPVMVGFNAGADANAGAIALAAALNAVANGNFKASVDTTTTSDVVVELGYKFLFIEEMVKPGDGATSFVPKVAIKYSAESTCNPCEEIYKPIAVTASVAEAVYVDAAGTTSIVREKEFATGSWLIQNYRLPTNANLRFSAAFEEERPLAGQIYNQFVLKYVTPRHIGGTSVIGEMNQSFTNHVFYVPGDITVSGTPANLFETELKKLLAGTPVSGTASDNFDLQYIKA